MLTKNNAGNYGINNNKTTLSNSFEYKKKIGSKLGNISRLVTEVVVLLKYLRKFWRSLALPLINCEIELDLTCSRNSICEISRTAAVAGNPDANPPVPTEEATLTTGAKFQINNTKLYVPVVILPITDNIKFLENIKKGFKRTGS